MYYHYTVRISNCYECDPRNKILEDTGVKYSLDRVERAMYLEGHLKASDVFEPKRKREWEWL